MEYGVNIMFLLMICFIRGPEVRTGHQVLLIMNTRRHNAEYIVKALDFLENEVMINMPVSILDEYLGLYIAFEGRVFHSCELEDGLDYTSKRRLSRYRRGI